MVRSASVRTKSTTLMWTSSPPIPVHEGAAGGTVEDEGERLAVGGRPFGDDVGEDASVVDRVVVGFDGDGVGDVDPVSPHVAGEADVEQVRQRLTSDWFGQVQQLQAGDRPGHLGA